MAFDAGKVLGALLGGGGNAPNLETLAKLAGATQNPGDLGELVKAIQGTDVLSAEKLAALKNGVQALASGGGVPANVLAPLTALLQSVRGDSPQENQQLWATLKPYLGDPDKLSALTALMGQYGGKLLSLLKTVFLRD